MDPNSKDRSAGAGPGVDRDTATAILRAHVDAKLTVVAQRRLHGGMVNSVQEWITDGRPRSVVVKLAASEEYDQRFHDEFASLRWYRQHTTFPVPEPYACLSGNPGLPGTCLLMQKLEGRNLGEARLSKAGEGHCQRELARIIADLHDHHRDSYGPAWREVGPRRWLDSDLFALRMAWEFDQVKDRLSGSAQATISRLLDHLDAWLPESGSPTLIHGDLWATNILVNDSDPERPRITGFVDGLAYFADVEFELAYLRVFETAIDVFFAAYAARHPLRDGFDRRCRVYWLNTMLIHVRHFGNAYLPAAERLATEIETRW